MNLRPGNAQDVEAIARLHASSWQHAYAAIMPSDYLTGALADEMRALWRTRLADAPGPDGPYLVLGCEGPELLGFAYLLPEPGGRVLLDNLHVEAGLIGSGVGHRILTHLFGWMAVNHPGRAMYLEVLQQNERAIGFYERHRGTATRSLEAEFPGFTRPVVEYEWPGPLMAELAG
ncbi:GNAT family N-acetyltransferase [Kitasatospora sp. NPDC002227]|uniref:GNAT family N-acetyltransferase n=1 Tax=Kitasatospora sp. NPDC002227 TaxID=3154773 RepID=UPI0033210CCD